MLGNELTENGEDSQQFRRQGSIRKVLPSLPDAENPMSVSAKMIDRQVNKSKQCYAPFFLEYSLMAEYNVFCKKKILGVYAIPAAKTPLIWYGVIFIHQGFYEEGIFRFLLHIPEDYPNETVPRVFFQPPIFHPSVNYDTGEVDLSTRFPKWRPNVNYLWNILIYVQKIFYKIDISSPVNQHAATLLQTDIEMFKFKVAESMRKCKDFLFDSSNIEDNHEIRFSNLDNQQFEDLRKTMIFKQNELNGSKTQENTTPGFSWVDPDNFHLFSENRITS